MPPRWNNAWLPSYSFPYLIQPRREYQTNKQGSRCLYSFISFCYLWLGAEEKVVKHLVTSWPEWLPSAEIRRCGLILPTVLGDAIPLKISVPTPTSFWDDFENTFESLLRYQCWEGPSTGDPEHWLRILLLIATASTGHRAAESAPSISSIVL